MNQLGTQSARETAAATAALFDALARRLARLAKVEIRGQVDDPALLTLPPPHARLTAADVRQALEATLAEQFGQTGGVLLVWYDAVNGMRCNPAGCVSRGGPERRGKIIKRDGGDED